MTTPRANLRTVKIVFEVPETEEVDDVVKDCASSSSTSVDGTPTSISKASSSSSSSAVVPLLSGTFLFAIGGFDGKNFLKNMEVLAGGSGAQEWQTYINFNKPITTS